MSAEFRYHVASLSAVFLALGIGILVGTAFVGARVVERHGRLISRLEAQVTDLRAEARERERTEDALRRAVPILVKDRLAGLDVLIAQAGTDSDAADRAEQIVRAAGGTTHRLTLPSETWAKLARDDPGGVTASAQRLANAVRRGEPLDEWRDSGLVRGETENLPPTSHVVLAGGTSAGNADPGDKTIGAFVRSRDLPMIEVFCERGVRTVGIETYSVELSCVRVYRAAGIATVDSVDRAIGEVALPFALTGDMGAFGLKPTADRVLSDNLSPTPSPSPSPTPNAPNP